MVIGSRVTGNRARGASHPAATLRQLAGLPPDPCVLARALHRSRAVPRHRHAGTAHPGMTDRNYGWTVEMQIKGAQKKLRALEVPVSYRPRIGVSKVSGTLKGTVLAGFTILRVIGQSAWQTQRSRRGRSSLDRIVRSSRCRRAVAVTPARRTPHRRELLQPLLDQRIDGARRENAARIGLCPPPRRSGSRCPDRWSQTPWMRNLPARTACTTSSRSIRCCTFDCGIRTP